MLTELIDDAGVTPAVNQVELHSTSRRRAARVPRRARHPHRELGARPAQRAAHRAAAHRTGRDPRRDPQPAGRAAVARRGWQHADSEVRGPERQRENADVFGFSLTGDQVAAISALDAAGCGAATPTPTRRCRHRTAAGATPRRQVSVEPWHPPPSTPSTTTSPSPRIEALASRLTASASCSPSQCSRRTAPPDGRCGRLPRPLGVPRRLTQVGEGRGRRLSPRGDILFVSASDADGEADDESSGQLGCSPRPEARHAQ